MTRSAYERTVNQFRADLLATEGRVRQQLAASYRQTQRAITAQLTNLPDDATYRRLRLHELARQIEVEIGRLTGASTALIENGQRAMTRLGPHQAAGLVQAQAPELSASFTRLPVRAFETMVGSLADGTPLRGVLGRYGEIAASEAGSLLQDAIARGINPRETAKQLRETLGTMEWEAERIARTEQIRAYRESSRATYLANSDIVTGYRRLAAKSARSCPVCLALDGTISPTSRMMSSHPGCRCGMTPVVRGMEDAFPPDETGAEWFARQDDVTQRRVLGAEKARLYQNGEVALSDLVVEWDDPTWGAQVGEIPLRELRNRGRIAA